MAEIVDQHGQPLTREIASIRRDVSRVFYGGVQFNEDDTLKARGGAKGLKIYQDLQRDAHAGAVLAKRKLAVTSRPWDVLPASDRRADKKAAEVVKAALQHLRFNAMCKRLLQATLTGFSVAEVLWEVRDGLVLPRRVVARDPRRFVFGIDDSLRLITREAMIEGEPMPDRKFIVHRRGADDDSPYGMGLGGALFWPVFFKRQGITFWLTFADKFGSPTAHGKYPNGAGKPEQAKLLQALQAIAQDAGIITPEGMSIELLEASRSGSVDTYEKLVRYMDEQISKVVLGETMSTTASSAGMGSSQADVQNGVRIETAVDDADELTETLDDTLVRWIVELNVPGAGLPSVVRQFDEPEDTAKLSERDQRLVQMGWEPSQEYIQATYGEGWTRKATPMPLVAPGMQGQPGAQADDGEDTATDGNTAADLGEERTPSFADGAPLGKATQQRAFNAARQEAMQAGAEALAADWADLVGVPVRDVEQLAAELESNGGDLVQFRERLTGLLARKPDPAVVEKIAQATFAANVMGRGLAPKRTWVQKLAGLFSGKKG